MPIESSGSEHRQQPGHPTFRAALLMVGVALVIVLIAAAGVMT